MNAAGNDEQRADKDNKTDVFVPDLQYAMRVGNDNNNKLSHSPNATLA